MQSCCSDDCIEGVGVWDGLRGDVLGVGDSDGLGVGCAIANDIELKSIIVAAVANHDVTYAYLVLSEFALETDVFTSSSLLRNTA
jgi:hypothetical protein